MDSRKLFERGEKPEEEKPVKRQPQEEPDEPISKRKSHLSPREGDFDRNRREEPEADPEESPVEPEEEAESLTIDEMLEMKDEELEKYGIDDPKTWKSYQRLMNKKETEWNREKERMQKELADLQKKTSQRREEPEQQQPQQQRREPLKPPVKPRKPVNYDYTEALTDPNSESALYLRQMEQYREDKDAYQDKMFEQLTGYVSQEQQTRLAQQRREQVKSQSLSRFQERGLSAKDATELYDMIEQAYMSDAETGADIFVNLFKGGKRNGEQQSERANTGRRKLPDNILMPPGVDKSTAKPVDSSSKSFMKSIQGSNQSRRIILNREKRK